MTSKSSDKNGRNELMVYSEDTFSLTKKVTKLHAYQSRQKKKKAETQYKFSNLLHPGL